MQLLKNREEGLQTKSMTGTKERKRSKYKSDEVESMDKVQLLGEAFQKIQMATGIHVRFKAAVLRTPASDPVHMQRACEPTHTHKPCSSSFKHGALALYFTPDVPATECYF